MATLAHRLDRVVGVALTVAIGAGCLPPGKETIELPEPTSELRAAAVGQLTEGTDTRNLRVDGDRLYVADDSGLLIYDITDRGAPALAGRIRDGRVDQMAFVGDTVYTIAVSQDVLREYDVSDPSAARLLTEERSVTRTFGGLDAIDGLVWHAVGSSPPSRVFFDTEPVSLASSCLADDRERGIMDVWLYPEHVVLSIHFDDFAGDGLDGNGGFGFALFDLSQGDECPSIDLTDTILMDTHGLNRSEFEERTNSDLQADFDPTRRSLYLTGEQRVRRYRVDAEGVASLRGELAIPDVLDVSVDRTSTERPEHDLVGLANGDFVLAESNAEGGLSFATVVETPGTARAVAAAVDGQHFYVADGTMGVTVVAIDNNGGGQ